MPAPFRFLVPSTLADAPGPRRLLEQFLRQGTLTPVEVHVAPSYDELATALMSGAAAAAWAPPYACARLEAVGLPVALRAVRRGQATYRAALVCRADRKLTLAGVKGKRAAWVDPESLGGHLLAAALLREHGLTVSGQFVGSYKAAVSAVLDERADVASVYAPAAAAGERLDLAALTDGQASLHVIAFTEETPNDGVVLGPFVNADFRRALNATVLGAAARDDGREVLAEIFKVDGFEPAPAGSYRPLYLAMRQLRSTA